MLAARTRTASTCSAPCHPGCPSWRGRRVHPLGPGSPLHPVFVQHRHAVTDSHGPPLAVLAVTPGILRGASRGTGVGSQIPSPPPSSTSTGTGTWLPTPTGFRPPRSPSPRVGIPHVAHELGAQHVDEAPSRMPRSDLKCRTRREARRRHAGRSCWRIYVVCTCVITVAYITPYIWVFSCCQHYRRAGLALISSLFWTVTGVTGRKWSRSSGSIHSLLL
jgi:hypothetical protein